MYLHECLNFHGKLVGQLLYHSHSDPLEILHAARLGFPHVQRSFSEGHPGNSARRASRISAGRVPAFQQFGKRMNVPYRKLFKNRGLGTFYQSFPGILLGLVGTCTEGFR